MKRIITGHTVRSPRIPGSLRFAVASDIHSSPYDDVLETFAQCDAVLIPGDLVDRHRRDNSNAFRFLREVPEIVPVFLSVGNHEAKYRHAEEFLARAAESTAQMKPGRKQGNPDRRAEQPDERTAGYGVP